jgi:hypothetical protein
VEVDVTRIEKWAVTGLGSEPDAPVPEEPRDEASRRAIPSLSGDLAGSVTGSDFETVSLAGQQPRLVVGCGRWPWV